MVVLPTPGPPVMTSTLDISASRIAATWLSARASPVLLLDPRQRLLRIDLGPGQRAVGQAQQPLGDDLLGPVQTRQKDAGVSPTLSAITVPSASSRSSAVRTSSCGTSSNSSASGTSSSVGKPQWPSSIASVSA